MSLRTSHSDDNLVIEEALVVNYSNAIISGSWTWESISVSGSYERMRECHRYARKSFRYVGMTYTAAAACKTDMITAFTRTFKNSFWNGATNQGAWNVMNAGTQLMADVSMVPSGGDAWDVAVRISEDDVRTMKVDDAYTYSTVFATEISREYGSNGHGGTETEG